MSIHHFWIRARNIIRRIRWRWVVAILLIGWLVAESLLIFAIHNHAQNDYTRPADVIILLGPPLQRRVEQTVDVWQQGLSSHILCTGGVYEHLPTLTQAQDCYEQLTTLGVPADAITLENISLSTEENALYARNIMTEHGWQNAILVSDATHLLRAQWLFSRYGIETYISPVSFSEGYLQALGREVIAFHWQWVKDLLRLPVTHVSGV